MGRLWVSSSLFLQIISYTFTDSEMLELWGWLTPSGKCDKGVCTGEIKALGDPGY